MHDGSSGHKHIKLFGGISKEKRRMLLSIPRNYEYDELIPKIAEIDSKASYNQVVFCSPLGEPVVRLDGFWKDNNFIL